jgi:predicted Zn-dependent protease with MMP-like domain
MDCSETWMALASLGRYDGRRIDERSRQHLFRTSLSITLYSYGIYHLLID